MGHAFASAPFPSLQQSPIKLESKSVDQSDESPYLYQATGVVFFTANQGIPCPSSRQSAAAQVHQSTPPPITSCFAPYDRRRRRGRIGTSIWLRVTHTSAPVPPCDGAPSSGTSPLLQWDLPLRRFSVALQPMVQRASRECEQRISLSLSRPLANSLIHGVPVLLLSSCQGARASRHRRDLIADENWPSELTVDFRCCRADPAILLCLVAGDRLHAVRVLVCSESCRG